MVKSEKIIALWKLSIVFSTIILLIPTVSAETLTFSDLGIATELSSGREANTPVGTFYISSNKYPLEVSVNAFWKLNYRLAIYLNDMPLKSGDFSGDGRLSVTISPENLKVGKNTIYVKGTSLHSVYTLGDVITGAGSLIIYGTSKISSLGISVPTTPAQTPDTQIVSSVTLTFSDLKIATELSSGREANTPVGTFYISSNNYPLEISVNAYNQRLQYRLTIYLNDAPLQSGDFSREGTLSVTVPPENLKAGKNTIYVKGTSLNSMYVFGGQDNLIIYGTSKITSLSIVLPSESPTTTPIYTSNSGQPSKSASVSLHGEKTDVVLGEDILLKLSAVSLITKPKMHVQVIIIPPSGMSVTSSEFSKSGAGQFTSNYELYPGDGKDIEVRIKSNQVGDFNVNGRIIYYFGDEKDKGEDYTLNLPVKVRKESVDSAQNPIANPAQKSIAGFRSLLAVAAILIGFSIKRGLKR